MIDIDSQRMLPRANEIIEQARITAGAAVAALTVSEARTRTGIIAVGIGMVALGLGWFLSSFSFHHAEFACGDVPCSGHPCQKHPWTLTATRAAVKAISIVLRGRPGTGQPTR